MDKEIKYSVYVLGDNIDTDQILTAEFMKINPTTPEGYKELGALAMCGCSSSMPTFVDAQTGKTMYPIIVARQNFGCGSSREHAPIALGASGVKAVIAQSFARIFFRNCIATGELLPIEIDTDLTAILKTGDKIGVDFTTGQVRLHNEEIFKSKPIGALSKIVSSGGLFPYARAIGKIRS